MRPVTAEDDAGRCPSSQTASACAAHAPPFAVSRHFASSIVGTKVLFAFAIRLMNAESGHSLWHHFEQQHLGDKQRGHHDERPGDIAPWRTG